MGTPDFSVPMLDILNKSHHNVIGVVTVSDKPAGRGQKIKTSAIKDYAIKNNLLTLQPENLKDPEFINDLQKLNADLFVVIAFRMLPEVVWGMPKKGTINLHASLLPQYRGAAPINWAVINGEKETGVTTFFINERIDTGDMIQQDKIQISDNMTAGELHDQMMNVGANLLVDTIEKIRLGNVKPTKQDFSTELKPAPKIFRDDCKIDLNKSAQEIHNLIRGMSPYPAAWLTIENSKGQKKSLKIYRSSIEYLGRGDTPKLYSNEGKLFLRVTDGVLKISEVQLEGKKKMSSETFLTGYTTDDWKIND